MELDELFMLINKEAAMGLIICGCSALTSSFHILTKSD